ncbi:hypothetical protein HUT19_05460 [Streptomyces sp. NA02950]|uniref:hypothetical protein n=1 Tax=Streptomyces sp. NA02950 TaxID=2742137 RepID=UPI00158FC165|nr:hypothetical protein [Streptomyces sp. NA02950]QKV91256.1 hypothetical protein HUT19_05460 [Streptomyces sp. NA02950]
MAVPALARSGSASAPRMLQIYLNDHLAGATAGVGLARRMSREHRHTAYSGELTRLKAEVAHDRKALLWCMAVLDVPIRRYKVYGAWAGERITRLRPRGRTRRRSGLNTVLELEAMRLGVEGKALLWRTLLATAVHDSRLETGRLAELLDAAGRQLTTLDSLHARAVSALVSPGTPEPHPEAAPTAEPPSN